MADAFPVLSRKPGAAGYSADPVAGSTKVANAMSGLPVVNELFTFVPVEFKVPFNLMAQADYDAVMAHYRANRGVPFNWVNDQDTNTYEVVYAKEPQCKLDRLRTLWKIDVTFIQYSPL